MTTTTARTLRNIPDDAPATAFAPTPVGAYRRGFEDRYYDNAWFCPYRASSTVAAMAASSRAMQLPANAGAANAAATAAGVAAWGRVRVDCGGGEVAVTVVT